jgi:dCTP deaminase
MILSDGTILNHICSGKIGIDPFEAGNVESASIDLRLGNKFLYVKGNQKMSLGKPVQYETMIDTVILPKEFILATTMETIALPPDITAFVEGRSSIGRMGLFIQNAGWVDPGFKGQITLELFNASKSPIHLEAGRRICQLVLCQLDLPAQDPYCGKYQGQSTVTGSRIEQDREVSDA